MFLADDSLIVRAGMRPLLSIAGDLQVVGKAGDFGSLVAGGEALAPQVIVSDIRVPPTFQLETLVQRTTQAAVAEFVERVFMRLSRHAIARQDSALRQLLSSTRSARTAGWSPRPRGYTCVAVIHAVSRKHLTPEQTWQAATVDGRNSWINRLIKIHPRPLRGYVRFNLQLTFWMLVLFGAVVLIAVFYSLVKH